ncbi:aldehyde dehydrogenase family protein [Aurantiacibacter xanthus]|uniref:Aldehyde dehydrogenase family protein n=1 Tax=Aurantiacibacter xanthus TaxID=1784712 RepID=A0A3A1P175_9SPHN|nr:aldehyde dehydrogenase family protein [Aurantiacibacter xanthus]RIV82673.1 aldehyde dehydrogenase family protein [Aurantiacibacter xanthus]
MPATDFRQDEALQHWQPRHLVGGELLAAGAPFGVTDPSSGKVFAECPEAGVEELERAVAAARAAWPAWKARSLEQRRAVLHDFAAVLEQAAPLIAPLLSREQGKPLPQAEVELKVSAIHIRHLSSLPLADQTLRADDRGAVVLNWRPLGVVGGIAPWNFPVALAMHKVAQALYTGNTLVLKPSPYTPLATLAVAELAQGIFPPGVLNILAGGNAFGAGMTAHPGIDKISFTGSVATGKQVMQSASASLKRITLELGGNDAAIVLDDADIEAAAAGLARSAFYNCGQICMAVKRIYAHHAVHDELAARIAEKAQALKVGSAFEEGVEMGPVQNRMQYEKVLSLVDDARSQPGAMVLAGGAALDRPGYFIAPTVITGLDDSARLVAEEQFGPVIPIISVPDEDDAIVRANAGTLGLGGSVWGRDGARCAAVARRLDCGTAWINRHGVNESDVPFGGMKESGYGREHGVMGLHSYMEMQAINAVPPSG